MYEKKTQHELKQIQGNNRQYFYTIITKKKKYNHSIERIILTTLSLQIIA